MQRYARNLFFALRLEDTLASDEPLLSREDDERIRAAFRANLPRAFASLDDQNGEQQLRELVIDVLRREALEALWREAAERTLARGREWFFDKWLRSESIDFFLRAAYGEDERQIPKPDADDLIYAFAGFPQLVEEDQAKTVRAHFARRSLIPRLLVRLWPEAAAVLAEEEGLTGMRENLAEILASVERLKAEQGEGRPPENVRVARRDQH